jgi:hypothetical protein
LVEGDLGWAGWYLLYHFPLLLPLRLTVGTANPLMRFDARVAVTMAGAAAVYSALCLLV